jgi:glycosyltransferase involved in cell wall biosynthesis
MADPLRVIHIARPAEAELQRHVTTLTEALVLRHVQTIVAGPLDRRFREELSRRDVRWANVPLPENAAWHSQRTAAEHLRRFLRAAQPDVVHAHGFQAAFTAWLALRNERPAVPIAVAPHGVPYFASRPGWERLVRRHAYRRVLSVCEAIIAGSEAERSELLALAPAGTEQRLHVVVPGVEPRQKSSLFDTGQKRLRVGLHQDAAIVAVRAHLRPGVPVEDFLQAAALLSEEIPNVEFAILGDGPRMEELKALSHELRLSGSAVFLGTRADAREITSCCNVFVALTEGPWGVQHALEALSRDLRVVAADLPILREVFADVQGVSLVQLSDHRAVANAMRHQLEQFSVDEEDIKVGTGMVWGLSEVLASQDEYDLDRPGLDPRDRAREASSDIDRLLARYSTANMAQGTLEVYRQILTRPPATK